MHCTHFCVHRIHTRAGNEGVVRCVALHLPACTRGMQGRPHFCGPYSLGSQWPRAVAAPQGLCHSGKLLEFKERKRFRAAPDLFCADRSFDCIVDFSRCGLMFAFLVLNQKTFSPRVMSEHVLPETAPCSCPVVAIVAFEWSFSCVGEHVFFEPVFYTCPVRALGACVRFFTSVNASVILDCVLISRPVVAVVATVWLFSRVLAHVHCQIALASSPVVALVAMVWLFSRMHAHMNRELALTRCHVLFCVYGPTRRLGLGRTLLVERRALRIEGGCSPVDTPGGVCRRAP